MSALNFLASTPCLDIQSKADQFLFSPAIYAGRKVAKLLPNLATTGFSDTIVPRLLLVAQSVISLIALPFKILVAVFTGLDAMIFSENPKSWINLSYAMSSVGIHALAIPAGIVMACLSTDSIAGGIRARALISDDDLQTFAQEQAMRWASAFGVNPASL